jgi:RimJ/RimL family protein N-acetyltransferase
MSLVVRRAVFSDFPAMFDMKCDPEDVRWSGFATAPTWENLFNWFTKAIDDPDRLLFMVMVDGHTAGYCNWRRWTDDWFEPSSGTLPRFRNRGIARDARTECIKFIRTQHPNAKFECWISINNISAQKSAMKNGFAHDGKIKGVEFLYPTPRIEQMMHYVIGAA